VLPPIAALLFTAVGRHPLAGIAAAFAGVSGGFSANLLPSTLDVLLIGFTQEAVDSSKLLPGYTAQVLGNYYFMIAATPLLTLVGTWVTHRFVEPRLGPWPLAGAVGVVASRAPEVALPSAAIAPPPDPLATDPAAARAEAQAAASQRLEPLSPAERRGIAAAVWALLAVLAVMALVTLPPGAPLRLAEGAGIARFQPFFDSMVVWVLVVFLVPGIAYGLASGTIRNDRDVAEMAGRTMSTMGTYIVLAFAAAQFVSYFAWSNLGAILAITGADLLRDLGLQGGLLLSSFVVFSALIDVFIASASAKWAVMAPVFVPMFALLGFTPEATQAVFRVGDSCTNVVTPLMPYMPFVLACAQRYVPRAGTGTMVAMMLPYFFAFLGSWTGLLLLFYALDLPIGPGVGMRLPG
jgi:aminobenzoyl-glutamate transport protein